VRPLARISEYLSVALGRYSYGMALAALAAAAVSGVMSLSDAVGQMVKTPGATPRPAIEAGLMFSHLAFGMVSMSMAGLLAGELASEALFHLSLPVRREEYALAWLLTAVWVPLVLEIVSPAVPLAILDPRLITGIAVGPMVLRAAEDSLMFSTILWSALLKRKGVVTAYGLTAVLFLPAIVGLVLAITGVIWGAPPAALRLIFYILPATTGTMMGGLAQVSDGAALIVCGSLAIVSQLGLVFWFRNRLEVS